MCYGWTVDTCLKMPAVQFFLFYKESVDTYKRRLNEFLSEMCYVAGASAYDKDSRESLSRFYFNRAHGIKPKSPNVLDAASPQSAKILGRLMGQNG